MRRVESILRMNKANQIGVQSSSSRYHFFLTEILTNSHEHFRVKTETVVAFMALHLRKIGKRVMRKKHHGSNASLKYMVEFSVPLNRIIKYESHANFPSTQSQNRFW